MPTRALTRRLEAVERRLGQVDEAERWETSRAWWVFYITILRNWLDCRISKTAHDAWLEAHPSPCRRQGPLTPEEIRERDRVIGALLEKLQQVRTRLEQQAPEVRDEWRTRYEKVNGAQRWDS